MTRIIHTGRSLLQRLKIPHRICCSYTEGPARAPEGEKDGIERAIRILRNDFKRIKEGKFILKEEDIFPNHCDIAIIGGGIMGSAIAYFLKQRTHNGLKIVVIERDPTYTRASTTLSVGGMRQQFSLPENIQMSLYSAEFLRNIKMHLSVLDMEPPDIQFNPHGYLCLASDKGAEQLQKNYNLQNFKFFELLFFFAGLENEGWFDPWALLNAFKRKAISMGTRFINGEVIGFDYREDLDPMYVQDDQGAEHPYQYLQKVIVKTEEGHIEPIKFAIAILAAGPNSGSVAKLADIGVGPGLLRYPIPVEPRKRYVFVYHSQNGPGIECPLVIDPTGTYFRREGLGGNFVGGRSPLPSEEPDVKNLDVDYTVFENQVWPTLAHRVPSFEAIKLKSAWAGYYDYNTFDQNGIVGRHPYYPNLMLATGFSGHGIQQAPAVGRAITELIIDTYYKSIDLNRFGFERILSNNPIYETNIF
uniref:FAD-dependent oxidoreductase domain-containing protein 1 n=1 Tax=Strigamia maritima TaxID=126957 RepID=T1JA01_STRMM